MGFKDKVDASSPVLFSHNDPQRDSDGQTREWTSYTSYAERGVLPLCHAGHVIIDVAIMSVPPMKLTFCTAHAIKELQQRVHD